MSTRSACCLALACVACVLSLVPAVRAEPITAARVEALPEVGRAAWQAYLDRSGLAAAANQAALDAELAAAGLSGALPAPGGPDFTVRQKPGDPWFASDEASRLADVVLSFQTPSGGWSKHTDYTQGVRKPGMLFSSQYKPGGKPHYLCTFDNRSTIEQLHFLANVHRATNRTDCADAFLKGLDFVLAAQFPSGGWPQVYPLEGGYHDHITFNDDAMTRVVRLLQAIDAREPQFALVDEARRARSSAALRDAIACILKLQVTMPDGTKSVWSAQHDAVTLLPADGRAFEPATLSGGESVRVIEFLMSLPEQTPEVIAAIESSLKWFDRARITDIRKTTIDGRTAFVSDPASTEVYWARFYHLQTSKPVFPGRDGILHPTYEEMAGGQQINYTYYLTGPQTLLEKAQAEWRQRLTKQGAK
jgi:PelA/Pel-15E family pectate lyase